MREKETSRGIGATPGRHDPRPPSPAERAAERIAETCGHNAWTQVHVAAIIAEEYAPLVVALKECADLLGKGTASADLRGVAAVTRARAALGSEGGHDAR